MSLSEETAGQPYLTFQLGEEQFAIPVKYVQEIIELGAITEVPHALDYIRGIVNLRGQVLPVMNTRKRFGLPTAEDTTKTRIIVLDVPQEGEENLLIGAVVDAARQVANIAEDQIMPPPKIHQQTQQLIDGVVNLQDHFVLLLNVENLFSQGDVETLLQQEMAAFQPEASAE